MIDIHSHILPGVDDGAPSIDVSISMAMLALADGIRVLYATPHHRNRRYDNPAGDIRRQVAELQRELEARHIPLRIVPGQEIRIHRELPAELEAGGAMALGDSRYLLLELPTADVPDYTEDLLYELSVAGYVPIIAHPERNSELASRPAKLRELIEAGACAQVTGSSLTGLFGTRVQQTAWKMCKAGLIHLIASDAHHPEQRPFAMRESMGAVGRELGAEAVEMALNNAMAVVNNTAIHSPIMLAGEPVTAGWWGRLWSKVKKS